MKLYRKLRFTLANKYNRYYVIPKSVRCVGYAKSKIEKNIYVHHYKSSFYIVHRMNQNGSMQICAIYFISRSLKSLLHTLIKYFFLFSNGKFSMVTIVSGYSFLCFEHILKMHTFIIRYKEMIMRYGLRRTLE